MGCVIRVGGILFLGRFGALRRLEKCESPCMVDDVPSFRAIKTVP
jgi:hypothetical protein